MKDKRVGKATQDGSGGFTGNDVNIKTGKQSGKTQTASVASPSRLTTGTKEGRGGSQKPAPRIPSGPRSGGYQVPLKRG